MSAALPTIPTLTPIKVGPSDLGALESLFSVFVDAIADPTTYTGDAFQLQGVEVFLAKNASGSPVDVTITSAADNFGAHHADDDIVHTVADGDVLVVGPLEARKYADSQGLAQVGYSDATDVTVAVLTFATTA